MSSSTPVDTERVARGRELIVDAFRAARATGRENWHEMTSAVLKNRILALTGRSFNERNWGVTSFAQFVHLYPDLVEVDASTSPARVRLLIDPDAAKATSSLPSPTVPLSARHRIRSDLWRAVLDYSSGLTYCWDTPSGRVATPNEADLEDQPALPTVSRETYREWRRSFADEHKRLLSPEQAALLERWVQEELGSHRLPTFLRGAWNNFIKRHVVELLEEWFADHGITTPPDLVQEVSDERDGSEHRGETDALRRLIHDAVDAMTRDELNRLDLPAAALLRLRR